MIEISILRVMSTREGFEKMFSAVPVKALEEKTRLLVKDIKRYYDTYTDNDSIDFVLFRDSFHRWHPQLDDQDIAYYDKILRYVETNLSDVSRAVLLNSMIELNLATDLATLLDEYNNGMEVDVIHDAQELIELALAAMERKTEDNWIKPDMDDLIESMDVKNGLTWRNPELAANLRPLVGGDFVIVAGRPDTGKTTFITDNATHMATQVDTRPILWLNNEGPGKRIVSRMIQSALGINIDKMKTLHEEGKLKTAYADSIGAIDRIRVLDIHDYWNWQVEELIDLHQPKLIIVDMIDNVKFSGMSLHEGARTDQILESMYQWFRKTAVKYDCAVIATSQISADGEGMQYPSMDMLKDSKTGKQGAADLQIMIGKSDAPELQFYRYISTPKNKMARPGKLSYFRHSLIFSNEQARYVEEKVQHDVTALSTTYREAVKTIPDIPSRKTVGTLPDSIREQLDNL